MMIMGPVSMEVGTRMMVDDEGLGTQRLKHEGRKLMARSRGTRKKRKTSRRCSMKRLSSTSFIESSRSSSNKMFLFVDRN